MMDGKIELPNPKLAYKVFNAHNRQLNNETVEGRRMNKIEDLQAELESLKNKNAKAMFNVERLLAEITKLKSENDGYSDAFDDQHKEIEHLRTVLEEIRDVALCSEGVEWYSMVASKALEG